MESLTRNNYEIWFIDYLDGQLCIEQIATLLAFLEKNPDLKQELCGVSEVSLVTNEQCLDQKEQLLKSPADIPGISAIDQLCIARMENDLSEHDAKMFDSRLTEDAGLEEKYAAFRLARLNASYKMVYPYTKELLRKTRVLTPWIITAISSAAVVLLALFLWPDSRETPSPSVAKTETVIPQTRYPIPETKQPASDTPQLASNSSYPKPDTRHPKTVIPVNLKPDSLASPERVTFPMYYLSHKSAVARPQIPDPLKSRVLLASSFSSAITEAVTTEVALTIPQYALQWFREKILGEDPNLVRKTRFSFWEVAGAGVNKINSIANTDMKLNREYDEKGDLLAVSFNSRLFDVESPVRSQEK